VNALEVEGLAHAFGARSALKDVSFAVPPGEFAVLLGLNGAGKTTLVSLVTRLYHARRGEIRVFGRALRTEPSRALAAIGIVFQQPTLDLDLAVAENLRYHAALHGLAPREGRARSEAELDRLGALDRANDRVRVLSGGLRRRVEIARALIHGPRLLLLDEPTVGLDLAARQAIIAHVRDLCRERGLAVLWATHLMDEIEASDQLILLHRGSVLRTGRAAHVLADTGAASMAEAFMMLTREAA
jgi:ABC-2 type transport system ATP-binding protein